MLTCLTDPHKPVWQRKWCLSVKGLAWEAVFMCKDRMYFVWWTDWSNLCCTIEKVGEMSSQTLCPSFACSYGVSVSQGHVEPDFPYIRWDIVCRVVHPSVSFVPVTNVTLFLNFWSFLGVSLTCTNMYKLYDWSPMYVFNNFTTSTTYILVFCMSLTIKNMCSL